MESLLYNDGATVILGPLGALLLFWLETYTLQRMFELWDWFQWVLPDWSRADLVIVANLDYGHSSPMGFLPLVARSPWSIRSSARSARSRQQLHVTRLMILGMCVVLPAELREATVTIMAVAGIPGVKSRLLPLVTVSSSYRRWQRRPTACRAEVPARGARMLRRLSILMIAAIA